MTKLRPARRQEFGMRILVTGADGALGTIVAARLRGAGDQVAGLCGALEASAPASESFAAGDLSDEGNARAVVRDASDRLGGLDAVVHLVGAFSWAPVEVTSVADWRRLFSINVETAVAVSNAALPHMAPDGSIVFVGAQSAQPAAAGFGAYGAAKSGLARLTEALAAEQRARGVRVNAILPATIDTPQNRLEMPDADPSQWTSPAAIADVIRFLISPSARAVSGALIPVTNPASE